MALGTSPSRIASVAPTRCPGQREIEPVMVRTARQERTAGNVRKESDRRFRHRKHEIFRRDRVARMEREPTAAAHGAAMGQGDHRPPEFMQQAIDLVFDPIDLIEEVGIGTLRRHRLDVATSAEGTAVACRTTTSTDESRCQSCSGLTNGLHHGLVDRVEGLWPVEG